MSFTFMRIFILVFIISGTLACGSGKKPVSTNLTEVTVSAPSKTLKEKSMAQIPTASLDVKMKHIELHVSFDYTNQRVFGKALLTIEPHFYPTNILVFDARKFALNKVGQIIGNDTVLLKYSYDSSKITITLNKILTKGEVANIFIDYIAHPNRITEKGSQAISDSKGLYFINPLKQVPNKPRQIWTQGEPECNSGWFPVIDKPNQKITQEIYITVENTETTLSNGELIWSKENNNGTRTDYWKQNLPHAPYLVMMAIGEFNVTKDYWRDNVEVNYYLEKEYHPYAKLIFGKTPKMMECFSKRLGVDYPWEKYSQVVVRDFVSGAMENTSAVIHYDAVQHNYREHLDNTHEDIIAHELFHHWFGDLVTCESWNNISLNESFATYGEYLWNEWEYGRDMADYEFSNNLDAYLFQRKKHDVSLFRPHFKSPNDVFDVVSYQKGGLILHMLRYSVGDEAFFTILKNYLTKYRFGTAEIHDLRLVAEEVTGRDLNWFFNQWYFNTGHPDLVISHKLADNKRSITILVEQKQDTILHGAFTLPLTIELHTSGGLKSTNIVIDKTKQAFTIESNEIIYNSIFDADKILPANIEESKPFEMWYHQANNADLLINRKIALEELNNNISADTSEKMLDLTLSRLLTDTFYLNRQIALNVITDLTIRPSENVLGLTEKLAKSDWNAYNRSLAIDILGTYIKKEYETTFRNGLNDSSYRVMAKSLSYLYELDTTDALRFAKANESNNNSSVVWALANLYAEDISPSHYDFFKRITNIKDKHWPYTLKYFGDYLLKQQPELQLEAITYLNTQKRGNNYYSYLTSGFYKLLKTETEQNKAAVQELLKKNKKDETIKASLQGKILTYDNILKALAE